MILSQRLVEILVDIFDIGGGLEGHQSLLPMPWSAVLGIA